MVVPVACQCGQSPHAAVAGAWLSAFALAADVYSCSSRNSLSSPQPELSKTPRRPKMANRGYDVVVDVDAEVCIPAYFPFHRSVQSNVYDRATSAIPIFRRTSNSTLLVSSPTHQQQCNPRRLRIDQRTSSVPQTSKTTSVTRKRNRIPRLF